MMNATSVSKRPELVCPAGSLRALQLAVDAGADAVYLGLRNATNARNFPGLNFDAATVREGIAYAHERGRKVLMALNTDADAADPSPWYVAGMETRRRGHRFDAAQAVVRCAERQPATARGRCRPSTQG